MTQSHHSGVALCATAITTASSNRGRIRRLIAFMPTLDSKNSQAGRNLSAARVMMLIALGTTSRTLASVATLPLQELVFEIIPMPGFSDPVLHEVSCVSGFPKCSHLKLTPEH